MSTNNKHKISEKELDNLLGQAFLNLDFNNPKNQELMETISNQVLSASPVNVGLINKAFFTKLMVLIAIFSTSAFIYFNYFSTNKQPIIKNTTTITPSSNSEQITVMTEQKTVVNTTNSITNTKQENHAAVSETSQKQEPTLNESPKYLAPAITYIDETSNVKNEDTNYVFPKLTEKEIKETINK